MSQMRKTRVRKQESRIKENRKYLVILEYIILDTVV